MNKLKSLLPGILIGIVLAVVGMVVLDKIQESKMEKEAVAFLSGFNRAEDKDSYVKNYNFNNNNNISVSISTSSADESGACDRIKWQREGLDDMARVVADLATDTLSESKDGIDDPRYKELNYALLAIFDEKATTDKLYKECLEGGGENN